MMLDGGDPLGATSSSTPASGPSASSSSSADQQSSTLQATVNSNINDAVDMQQAATEKFNDELALPWNTRKQQVKIEFGSCSTTKLIRCHSHTHTHTHTHTYTTHTTHVVSHHIIIIIYVTDFEGLQGDVCTGDGKFYEGRE